MRLPFLLLALLTCALLVIPSKPTKSPDFLPKKIFILAGQSNMAGRGGVAQRSWDGFAPPGCQPNPSILRLNAGLDWEEAHEPLHADIDVNRTCGVGPGLAFANAVLDEEPGFGDLGLVPCAVGGRRISEWTKGTWLYNEMVRRAKVAREAGGTIRAVLWFQGESDTEKREDAELYKERLEKFITDVRADLNAPNLFFFQVALTSGQGPFLEIVREAQLGVSLPNVVTVDAKGLPLLPDGLHLTTESAVRVGEMLADAFLRTISRPTHNSNASTMFTHVVCKFWMDVVLWSILVILIFYRVVIRRIF